MAILFYFVTIYSYKSTIYGDKTKKDFHVKTYLSSTDSSKSQRSYS